MKIFVLFIYIIIIFSKLLSILIFIIFIQHLQQLSNDHDLVLGKANAIHSFTNGFIEQGRTKDIENELFPVIDVSFDRRRLLRKTKWEGIWTKGIAASKPCEL